MTRLVPDVPDSGSSARARGGIAFVGLFVKQAISSRALGHSARPRALPRARGEGRLVSRRRPPRVPGIRSIVVADAPPITSWDTATRVLVAGALRRFGDLVRECRGRIENEAEPPVDVVLELLELVIADVLPPGVSRIVVEEEPPAA